MNVPLLMKLFDCPLVGFIFEGLVSQPNYVRRCRRVRKLWHQFHLTANAVQPPLNLLMLQTSTVESDLIHSRERLRASHMDCRSVSSWKLVLLTNRDLSSNAITAIASGALSGVRQGGVTKFL